MTTIIINKPIDYSTNPDNGDKNILNLANLPENSKNHFICITPLAENCEGLVVLTDEKNLISEYQKKYQQITKQYEVTVDHPLTRDAKKVLENGMIMDNEILPELQIAKEFNKGRKTIITVKIQEEQNWPIKKMFERLGYNVLSIKRTAIDKFKLKNLSFGRPMIIDKNR